MAPINLLSSRADNATANAVQYQTATYPGAFLLAFFSLLVALLIIPPMFWHYRNRNISATILVGCYVLLNIMTCVNAIIWRNDDIPNWYNGDGLCDVESKIQIAFSIAGPAALAGVLRGLANAMDTNRATLTKSEAQRRKDLIIDISLCIVFPALQMLFHWIVQPYRYWIQGIAGCQAVGSQTWLTVLLLYIPPLIWVLVDAYFAILILARLFRYRSNFTSVLAHSNTTKNRFMRLYIFCALSIFIYVPVQTYVLYTNLINDHHPFVWSEVHDPAVWNQVVMVPSYGRPIYQPFLWLVGGVIIFVFFGMGKDAVTMYRSCLLGMGFDRFMPSLRPEYRSRSSITGSMSTFSSKAKLFFKRKSSSTSWHTDSSMSRTASAADPISPKTMTFMEAIAEHQPKQNVDPEKGTPVASRPNIASPLAAVFSSKSTRKHDTALPLSNLSGEMSTVHADVAASPAVYDHNHGDSLEVIVRKEVRQDSETAEGGLPGVSRT